MILNRRRLLGAAALLGVTGLAPTPAFAEPPPPTIDGPGPLINWIADNREHVSLLVDDGRGDVFTHLADHCRPIASAVKVAHLAAYARAVVAGVLDPDGPVPVAEWERWWVPGSDGGAHLRAVEALGVTSEDTVTWAELAAVMIDFSDNAAPDLFRATLGDQALIDAAAAGGWHDLDVPSIAGEALLSRGTVPIEPDRRAQSLAVAQAYADGDPYWRSVGAQALIPPATPEEDLALYEQFVQYYDGAWSATVEQLSCLHRAAATDGLGPEVSAIMRRHLERPLAAYVPPGALAVGNKGGTLPAIQSSACTLRLVDGTVGVSVLSFSRLPLQVYLDTTVSGAPTFLSLDALRDEAVADRLRAAVAG